MLLSSALAAGVSKRADDERINERSQATSVFGSPHTGRGESFTQWKKQLTCKGDDERCETSML